MPMTYVKEDIRDRRMRPRRVLTGWTGVILNHLRRWDKVAMHCAAVPFLILLSVRASDYLNAQEPPTSQQTVNALTSQRMDTFDKRLEHLEKIGDAQTLAMFGALIALVVQIVQNKNRRPHDERKRG
jgi:hypothetical protein